ncbi:MAG: hypothetical protein QXI32_02215, partial [Candidatus Bathyarchaeia archaeon]
MTETKTVSKPTSPIEWLSANLIQLVAIAVIIIMATDVIIKSPKTPAASFLRDMVSLGAPFAILIAIIMTLRVN